jgi:hypothetical protein
MINLETAIKKGNSDNYDVEDEADRTGEETTGIRHSQ